MPADFPNSPTIGDTFSLDGRTWTWNGTTWDAVLEAPGITTAIAPLAYDPNTETVSIDLSAYYTSAETDSVVSIALADYDTSTTIDGKISTAINGLVDSAPSTLDTLNELAAALSDDASFATTVANQLGVIETDLDTKKTEVVVQVNSDITLVSGRRYFVDTSVARNLTLPASPAVGDEIQIFDVSNLAGTNNIVIDNNTNKINGILDTLTIDVSGAVATLVYTGSTLGWRI